MCIYFNISSHIVGYIRRGETSNGWERERARGHRWGQKLGNKKISTASFQMSFFLCVQGFTDCMGLTLKSEMCRLHLIETEGVWERALRRKLQAGKGQMPISSTATFQMPIFSSLSSRVQRKSINPVYVSRSDIWLENQYFFHWLLWDVFSHIKQTHQKQHKELLKKKAVPVDNASQLSPQNRSVFENRVVFGPLLCSFGFISISAGWCRHTRWKSVFDYNRDSLVS